MCKHVHECHQNGTEPTLNSIEIARIPLFFCTSKLRYSYDRADLSVVTQSLLSTIKTNNILLAHILDESELKLKGKIECELNAFHSIFSDSVCHEIRKKKMNNNNCFCTHQSWIFPDAFFIRPNCMHSAFFNHHQFVWLSSNQERKKEIDVKVFDWKSINPNTKNFRAFRLEYLMKFLRCFRSTADIAISVRATNKKFAHFWGVITTLCTNLQRSFICISD